MIRKVIDRRFIALLGALAVAGCASMGMTDTPPKAAADGTLTNASGMTLYTFDRDAGGKSACNGPCAIVWPPLLATDAARAVGEWTIVTRDDGGKQWAYKAKPLYLWTKDQKPGDKTGDGFNNVWHIAKQ